MNAGSPANEPGLRPPARLRVVIGWASLVGAGGGLVGFLYLAALHGCEHVLGPENRGPWPQLALLVAVGWGIGRLAKWLGSPGDVELLVDNVHVLEGRAQVRHLRSLLPISLACIASGGGAGPEAPLVQTTGTSAQWLAERLRVSADRPAHPDDRGDVGGLHGALRRPDRRPRSSRSRSCTARGLQYYEALLPSVVPRWSGYAIFVAASGLGLDAHLALRRGARAADALDLLWAAGRRSSGR